MICEQNPNLYLVKYFLSLNAGTHVGPPVDTRVPVGGLLLALHQKAAGEHQADDLNPKEHESERLHVFHPRLYFGPQLRLARAGERARQGHPVDHFVEPAAFQLLLDISPRLYISCVPPVAQVFFRFFDSKNKQTEHRRCHADKGQYYYVIKSTLRQLRFPGRLRPRRGQKHNQRTDKHQTG